MPATLIQAPVSVRAAGNKPKVIEEFIGRVGSKTEAVSIARMRSPGGWSEPGQTPEFDEYSVVFKGHLRVKTRTGAIDVKAGQAVIVRRGEWVQYSTPAPEGAEYMAVCLPAFGPDIVHREAESQTPADGRQMTDDRHQT
ncbi:MAG: cupin [Kiritimatiellaeota bacterium]|nr:cupin [Kiritimatiellota bacterium]